MSKCLIPVFLITLLFNSFTYSVPDKPNGFASVPGNGLNTTTGGEGGKTVIVSTWADLKEYCGASEPYIILVKGTITSPSKGAMIRVKSNKTIVGMGDDATLSKFELLMMYEENIIIRNLTIRDSYLGGDQAGKENDYDAIQADSTHHLWIDHCFFTNCGDGLLDLRKACNYVTVSWVHFSNHNKAFGIGWTDRNDFRITIHHCYFDNTERRNPSCDNAIAHMYNSYYKGVKVHSLWSRGNSQTVNQNIVFENCSNALVIDGTSKCYTSGLSGAGKGNTSTMPFDPADFYEYTLDPTSDVKSIVLAGVGPKASIAEQYSTTDVEDTKITIESVDARTTGTITGKVVGVSGSGGIEGAVVQLDSDGSSVTTDADGNFSISRSTAVTNNHHFYINSGNVPITIQNGFLNVASTKKSPLNIGIYAINGKLLMSHQTVAESGNNSFRLPLPGAGLYLIKVTLDNNSVVLKGSVGDRTFELKGEGSVFSLAKITDEKQTETVGRVEKITNYDIITVKKDTYLTYRSVIYKNEISGITIKMIPSAGTVTDIDKNVYQTVKIGDQVWTVENFRATRYNDGSPIQLDENETSWAAQQSGKYCFYDNDDSNGLQYGAIYNWYAVATGKLAPTGWHVPTDEDWGKLQRYLLSNGFNWDGTKVDNKTAKSIAAQWDWISFTSEGTAGHRMNRNNITGFSALGGGCREVDGKFYFKSRDATWWSTSQYDVDGAWSRSMSHGFAKFIRSLGSAYAGYSVRLVKD